MSLVEANFLFACSYCQITRDIIPLCNKTRTLRVAAGCQTRVNREQIQTDNSLRNHESPWTAVKSHERHETVKFKTNNQHDCR